MTDVQTNNATSEQATVDMKLEVVVLPVVRRRSGQGLLRVAGVAAGRRLRDRRGLPGGAADAAGLGRLDHLRHGRHRGGRRARSRACSSRSPTSTRRATSSPARGVDVSEVFHDAGGVFHHAGTEARVSGPGPEHADYGSFVSFSDPDGNGWLLQEINDAPAGPRDAPRRQYDDARPTWPRRCGARRRRTASTRRAPARRTRTGRTGTPSTWSPRRPAQELPA